MSLLPQQIIPATNPLGRTNPDGTVTIEKNWWLFLYNVSLNSLGAVGGLPAAALQELATVDSDAADTDAVVLRKPISNLEAQVTDNLPVQVDSSALLYASDALLQTPLALAQPVSVITVGGSPFTFTASFAGSVVISGGTVSALAYKRQGTTVATGLTAGIFPVAQGDQIVITHTGAPTATFMPGAQ